MSLITKPLNISPPENRVWQTKKSIFDDVPASIIFGILVILGMFLIGLAIRKWNKSSGNLQRDINQINNPRSDATQQRMCRAPCSYRCAPVGRDSYSEEEYLNRLFQVMVEPSRNATSGAREVDHNVGRSIVGEDCFLDNDGSGLSLVRPEVSPQAFVANEDPPPSYESLNFEKTIPSALIQPA